MVRRRRGIHQEWWGPRGPVRGRSPTSEECLPGFYGERRRLRNQFPTSTVAQTRFPRLDPVFKVSRAKAQDVKALDRELARVQAQVHDAVGPLLHLLSGVELEGLSVDEAQSTV